MKESPCTRVATVKSAQTSSLSVHPRPLGKLSPRGKKISNECLRRVQGEEVYGGQDDEEEGSEDDGLLKEEVDELFECEDLPIITKRTKNT